MTGADRPLVVRAAEAAPRTKPSNYPRVFAEQMAGRIKRPLGDLFGLVNFGVNLTRLAPGAASALLHGHSRQDEFVYVLEGLLTLVTEDSETVLQAGDCAGFKAGGPAHQLVNRSDADAAYLEVGDRTPGDVVSYPVDDLAAERVGDGWRFVRKTGEPYRDDAF